MKRIIRLHSLTMSRGKVNFLGESNFFEIFKGNFNFVNQQRGDLNFLCYSLYF